MDKPHRDERGDESLLGLLPAAGRLIASTWWHTTERTVGAGLRAGSRIARAALGHEAESQPFSDPIGHGRGPDQDDAPSALRERGAELLRRSADVEQTEDMHPAYARILDNLSPDEARILRLLATGPQPAIDIRRGMPLVSELVAAGLNLIGAEAGCRHPDRVPAYLNNLNRLGLIWFSRETLGDTGGYQVLEAQPPAVEAKRAARRTARTVRRSIHLTPFGADFCNVCFPLETSEIEASEASRTSESAPTKAEGWQTF